MLSTLFAPYVGQVVDLLADEAMGFEAETARYLGEGMLEADREQFEADFRQPGLWVPTGTHRSAHQYIQELLREDAGGTDFEGRVLLRGALEITRVLGIEGEHAASTAIRAWQVVYEQVERVHRAWDVPERVPVVAEVGVESSHAVGFLERPLVRGEKVARVCFTMHAADIPASSVLLLP